MAHCGLPVAVSRRLTWHRVGLPLVLSKSLSGRFGVSSCTYRVRAITLEAIKRYTSLLVQLALPRGRRLLAELCLSTTGSIRLAPNVIVREGEKVLNCIGDGPLLEPGGEKGAVGCDL